MRMRRSENRLVSTRVRATAFEPFSLMIQPYLFFNGRCTEAIEFYRRALNAYPIMRMLAKESPVPMQPENPQPGWEDRVVHAELRIADGILMVSDGCGDTPAFEGFSLSLCLPTREDAHKAFDALADGGKVKMPLDKTFWSPCFGMVQDRFGVSWMVTIPEQKSL